MSQKLHRVNFGLLVILGGLCVLQWRGEAQSRRRISELWKSQAELTHKVAEQEEALRGANEDLAGFRAHITELKTRTDEESAQIRAQVARLDQSRATLAHQVEGWRRGVEQYKAALETRDASLKDVVAQRDQLYAAQKGTIERANAAVASLNDLNEKYSDIVTRYNALVAQVEAKNQAQAAAQAQAEARN